LVPRTLISSSFTTGIADVSISRRGNDRGFASPLHFGCFTLTAPIKLNHIEQWFNGQCHSGQCHSGQCHSQQWFIELWIMK
jgi:hypothetical protein